jgi:hypothetical protein
MPPKKKEDKGGEETLTRIAIVNEDKCVGHGAAPPRPPPEQEGCLAFACNACAAHADAAGASPRNAVRSARRAARW